MNPDILGCRRLRSVNLRSRHSATVHVSHRSDFSSPDTLTNTLPSGLTLIDNIRQRNRSWNEVNHIDVPCEGVVDVRYISEFQGRRWLLPVDPPIWIVNRIDKIWNRRLPEVYCFWPPIGIAGGMCEPVDGWGTGPERAGHQVEAFNLRSLMQMVGGRRRDPTSRSEAQTGVYGKSRRVRLPSR